MVLPGAQPSRREHPNDPHPGSCPFPCLACLLVKRPRLRLSGECALLGFVRNTLYLDYTATRAATHQSDVVYRAACVVIPHIPAGVKGIRLY